MVNDDINCYLGVFAYPFVSLDFLSHDELDDYLTEGSFSLEKKKLLRKKTIDYINRRYKVYSYDEIHLFLDRWYLYPRENDGKKQISSFSIIFEHLRNFCKSFISQRDGKIVYKYWENEGDKKLLGGFCGLKKIYLFHSFNRLFPLDLLSILYMIDHHKPIFQLDGNYGMIEVSDIPLNEILKEGIAENHLHKGVSGSFLTMWDDFMQPVTRKNVRDYKELQFNNIYGLENDELVAYLWLAGWIRANLATAVLEYEAIEHKNFSECYSVKNLLYLTAWLRRYTVKERLQEGEYISSFEECILSSWDRTMGYMDEEEIKKYGFVKALFEDARNLHTSDENVFLYKMLQFVFEEKSKDIEPEIYDGINHLFLNYLRIKNFFYGLIVQQKTIYGLNHFQQLYYGNSAIFHYMGVKIRGIDYWERVIREQIQNGNLKKLELKMSFSKEKKKNTDAVFAFLKAYQNILHRDYCRCDRDKEGREIYTPIAEFPRIGLVVHFIKQEQGFTPEKCVEKDLGMLEHMQYGKLYQEYMNQVQILKELRAEYCGLDKFIVGIDVASLENAVPTWVFTSVFEAARDSESDPMKYHSKSNSLFQSLGFTIHAGEEFRHILSGLRRMYEAVKYLKFHSGDRIGHGIALGISPKEWHLSNPTIIIPRIEALENYLWAYQLLNDHALEDTYINITYLEKEIYLLAKDIYGDDTFVSTNQLIDAYRRVYASKAIFDEITNINCNDCSETKWQTGCILYKGFVSEKDAFSWNVKRLMTAMHCKKYVYKMNEPIHIKITEQDINIAIKMQKIVKNFINERGIILEVNPTSNVSIGNIDTLSENHIYSINQCDNHLDNVIVCVNSDDPAVFNTNVSNELGYIYFGMIEKGVSREAVLQWIDKLRKNGMKASFIRRKDSDVQLLQNLSDLLDGV